MASNVKVREKKSVNCYTSSCRKLLPNLLIVNCGYELYRIPDEKICYECLNNIEHLKF